MDLHWIFLNGCSVSGPHGRANLPSGILCTLTAVLVLNRGRPVPRDRVVDILWEGKHPENARGRVNTMLWRVREIVKKVGGDKRAFENRPDFLAYNDAEGRSDLAEIGELARIVMREGITSQEMSQRCMNCVEFCHTEFLPQANDHWSMITRESLRSGLLTIMESLVQYLRKQNRWGRITELAERMLTLDPTLELGHRHLIDLHSARKDFDAAKRHSEVLQKVMQREFDLDPEPETAAAIEALKISRHGSGAGRDQGKRPDNPGRSSSVILRRPSLSSAQKALDFLDAARDSLIR